MERGEYALSELTELAGVSARTVRYYISEGLLPPPDSVGPRATYSQSHLDRLLLIGELKDAYLPLREIRRRLDAMSNQEVRAALANHSTEALEHPETRPVGDVDDARSYLRRVLDEHRQSGVAPGFTRVRTSFDADMLPVAAGLPEDELTAGQPGAPGSTWRRVELGPDVELLIRDEAYERNRDRIEWLINWANRVIR